MSQEEPVVEDKQEIKAEQKSWSNTIKQYAGFVSIGCAVIGGSALLISQFAHVMGMWGSIIYLPFTISAIILGKIGLKNKYQKKYAIIGLVLSSILLIAILWLVVVIVIVLITHC